MTNKEETMILSFQKQQAKSGSFHLYKNGSTVNVHFIKLSFFPGQFRVGVHVTAPGMGLKPQAAS